MNLSSREKELIRYLMTGMSNSQIAEKMGIKEGTTKEFVSRIFKKLKLTNRTELAVWAHRQKFL